MRRPRHQFLREVTRTAHLELERAVEQAGFFDWAGAYGNYLRRLRLFHATLEQGFAGAGGEWLRRWRIAEHKDWLDSDLAALALAPLPGTASVTFRRPALSGTGGRLGALYVLIGSSLGARLLIKRAEALELPAAGGAGTAYLQGLSRSNDWPGFLDTLEREDIGSDEELSRGAISTFESILDHMAGAMAL